MHISAFSSQYISIVVWLPLMGGLVFFLDSSSLIFIFNFRRMSLGILIHGQIVNKPGCHKNLSQHRLQKYANVHTHTRNACAEPYAGMFYKIGSVRRRVPLTVAWEGEVYSYPWYVANGKEMSFQMEPDRSHYCTQL